MTILLIILALLAGIITMLVVLPIWQSPAWPSAVRSSLSLLIIVFMLIGSIMLYAKLGSPHIIEALTQRRIVFSAINTRINELESATTQLDRDTASWAELGMLYRKTSRFSESVRAFKQAIRLSHGSPEFILDYAKSLMMEADGRLTDEAKRSLEMLLLLEPHNKEATTLLKRR